MKYISLCIISVILFYAVVGNSTFAKDKGTIISTGYFPTNNNIKLVYVTTFGETITTYSKDGEFTISSSESDRFKYRQTLVIKENGVYIKETYQYMKIFLFIKKEGTYTYLKPFLRFPLPLSPGMKWVCEGEECNDGDTNKVKATGNVYDKEVLLTKAGRFETIKIETLVEGIENTKNKVTEWFAEGIGLIKAKIIIEGGGVMGFMRDLLGYGTIEFELKEIRKQ